LALLEVYRQTLTFFIDYRGLLEKLETDHPLSPQLSDRGQGGAQYGGSGMERYDYVACPQGYELACIWSSKYIRCICENRKGTEAKLPLRDGSILWLERL